MARITYAQTVTNLGTRMGNRTDITSDQKEQWINGSLLRLGNEYEHVELQAITDETLALSADNLTPVVTDLWWPEQLKDVTNGPLIQPKDKRYIEHQRTKPLSQPRLYYWWARKFYFEVRAKAATTVRIWYVKRPARWTSGEGPLDELYDPLVEMYAALIGFNSFRDFKNAHLVEVEANNWIANQNLPKRKAKFDDYRQGIQVRQE